MRCNCQSLTLKVLGMTTIKSRKKHFIPNFEATSVLLVAALAVSVLGAASGARAQTPVQPTAPSASPISPASPLTPPAAATDADQAAKSVDAAFTRLDVNKDDRLDKKEAEVMPVIAERFNQLDTNADGFLSREEFSKVGS